MTLTITLACDNAAFADDPGELSRILMEYARKIQDRTPHGRTGETLDLTDLDGDRLMDINGNTVGQVEVSE